MVHGEHGIMALLFGGGGGLVHNLLNVRGGAAFSGPWLAFDYTLAVLLAWAFNIAFADVYGQWIPIMDVGIGLSALAIANNFEKIVLRKFNSMMAKVFGNGNHK